MNGRTTRRVLGPMIAMVMAAVTLTACDTAPDIFVAIGDSYTSGPGITNQVAGPTGDPTGDLGSPAGCMRSDRNFPAEARADLADRGITFGRYWDFSCSGAKTGDFFSAQSTDNGTNIPQLDALGGATKVVTIGIGGNDIGFSDIITGCIAWQSCKNDYVHDGIDELRDRIDTLAPTIAHVLDEVHSRAPRAHVFVVGYPAILPQNPGVLGCQTMTQSNIVYLDGIQRYLNAMLEAQATANDAVFVDAYTPSIGHDSCSSDPWVNGLIAIPPVHPNAKGMSITGALVADAIAAALGDVGPEPGEATMVAVGDRFVAGAGITDVIGEPSECFRSPDNYPRLVRDRLADDGTVDLTLRDTSCNGARTVDLTESQPVANGTNPPQVDGVDADTRIVVVGVGVNDLGFAAISDLCIEYPDPTGCRHWFDGDGTDVLRERIDGIGPRLASALDTIRGRAPNALVVVGYPTILPADGSCPSLDLPTGDVGYLAGAFAELNTVLQTVAETSGAVFVDTATSSVGHDVCAGPDAWITPPGADVATDRDGLILHPNAAGTNNTVQLVAAAIEANL